MACEDPVSWSCDSDETSGCRAFLTLTYRDQSNRFVICLLSRDEVPCMFHCGSQILGRWAHLKKLLTLCKDLLSLHLEKVVRIVGKDRQDAARDRVMWPASTLDLSVWPLLLRDFLAFLVNLRLLQHDWKHPKDGQKASRCKLNFNRLCVLSGCFSRNYV